MSLFTRTDVTAVKIYKNYVLAGIGSKINIFDKLSTKLWQRIDGLSGQKIYGYVPSKRDEKILVFGGKQFTVLSLASSTENQLDNEVFCRLFDPIVCDDWIHSAVWIEDSKVALLTAHNVVQKWDTSAQTLLSHHPSRDNSILYSGLLLPLCDDVLVMAGTVFSEVIIHRLYEQEEPLHNLKGHKGVIFSISCKPESHMIVTTSDDRSVRIWRPNNPPTCSQDSIDYWTNVNFVCHHEMYGHIARVMRSCITNSLVISVGEDSTICYWDYHGKLLKKGICHQNSAIWSIDSDNRHIVTGGGDGAVVIHPLTVATDYCQNETINIDINTPKKVVFTARRNIVVLDANNLINFNFDTDSKTIFKLNHETTYKMVSVSSCRQMIAVMDMNGKLDVFVENCKDEASIIKIIDTLLNIGKILSMQFAGNRHLVLCAENGEINVLTSNNEKIDIDSNYILPPSKERWLTASAIDSRSRILVAGDRCGNIHYYVKGQKQPVRSFNKVHGRYGPTSINIRNNEVVTTGRDGSIKYFTLDNNGVKYMCARDLDFQWVEKFLDRDENMICGFQERVFVVYNISSNSKLLEVQCGGGHRSWDAIRYYSKENNDYEGYIKLIYLKNSDINLTTFKLSNIVSRSIINGSHSKEINCLKPYTSTLATFYITGGEDTTLRISSLNKEMKFKDEVIFKHLSSIRTLTTYVFDGNLLLISAGGRAQICIKNIKFIDENNQISIKSEEIEDYMIKGKDKERKVNQTWRNCTIDYDPEMRIMDLAVTNIDDKIIIFAGCSDAFLRVFTFKHKLELIAQSKYHSTCILKTNVIEILNKCVLITCTTRGEVTFWDVTDLTNLTPFFAIKTNKSGINGFTLTILSNNMLLVGTGGDDNAIHLVLLQIQDQNNLSSMQVLSTWSADKYHSSQITGLLLVDNFLLSASVDQRVTLLEWEVKDNVVHCDFVSQTFTDVADVQGMEILGHSDAITVCVFGKGIEVLAIRKSQ